MAVKDLQFGSEVGRHNQDPLRWLKANNCYWAIRKIAEMDRERQKCGFGEFLLAPFQAR